jgi:hypothetical protein
MLRHENENSGNYECPDETCGFKSSDLEEFNDHLESHKLLKEIAKTDKVKELCLSTLKTFVNYIDLSNDSNFVLIQEKSKVHMEDLEEMLR